MTAIKENKTKKTGCMTANACSDENVLSMYLREISRIPLLNREEEEKVARAAAGGNKAARDRLINGNLRFVVNVAKKYQGQGLSLPDLVSEGNIGLIQAVDRFDVEKGYHFISYAVWWIRQSILKAISEKSKMIRLPQNRANELLLIEKTRKATQEHQSFENEIREIAGALKMEKAHIAELINIGMNMISLNSPVSLGDNSAVLSDFVEAEQYSSPEQKLIQSALEDDIEDVLESLDKKEADIIRHRYGIGSHKPMSLKEIGEQFNLTKERIRQIENKAILRLRNPIRKNKLAPYVA